MTKHRTVKKIVRMYLDEVLQNATTETDMHVMSSSSFPIVAETAPVSAVETCEFQFVKDHTSNARDDAIDDWCCSSSDESYTADDHLIDNDLGSTVLDDAIDAIDGWCGSDNDDPLSNCAYDCTMTPNLADASGTVSADDILSGFDSLAGELSLWAIQYNVTHAALKELLHILGKHHRLPKDPRTLLRTLRSSSAIGLRNMKGSDGREGEYVYFGVEKELLKSLENDFPQNIDLPSVISMLFNVDGLPLYKSSAKQFWPILGKVYSPKVSFGSVFVVAIFFGSSKPSSIDEFLHDFVAEMRCLKQSGISFRSKRLTIKIAGFSCDAPARAFVKCIKGHTAYFGCEKCTQRGKYVDGRLTYPEIDAERRTVMSFSAQIQEEHHKGVTPLLELEIDVVDGFPLDYMHLVCLGAMRKLILNWMRGDHEVRISYAQVTICSDRLSQFTPCVCSEFSRKPRSLFEIDRWKAVELRNFLIYFGPLVLRSVLPDELYHHFMILNVAITILSSTNLCTKMHGYAANLLRSFVTELSEFYGKRSLTYNMHNLVHLADDVANFGTLDSFSCFQFESKLGCIKKQLRSGSKALAQYCCRKSELDIAQSVRLSQPGRGEIAPEACSNVCNQLVDSFVSVRCEEQLVSFSVAGLSFDTCKRADCYALTSNLDIVKINNIARNAAGRVSLHCKRFMVTEEFFTYPCHSSQLKIFKVSNLSSRCHVYHPEDILNKCMLLPWKKSKIAFPLLHA